MIFGFMTRSLIEIQEFILTVTSQLAPMHSIDRSQAAPASQMFKPFGYLLVTETVLLIT